MLEQAQKKVKSRVKISS